jgi:WD40 repeat protein
MAIAVLTVAHVLPAAAQSAPEAVAALPDSDDPQVEPGEPSHYATRPETYSLTPATFTAAALSPNRAWVAGATGEWPKSGDLLLWEVATRQLKFRLHLDRGAPTVAFSPDNAWLAVGTFNGELLLVDVAQAKLVAHWKAQALGIFGVAFSPDGKLLASPSIDGSVKVWDVIPPAVAKAGLPLRLSFDRHTDAVLSTAFAPDSKTLYAGCRDRQLVVWDLQKPRKLAVWDDLPFAAMHIAVSPDGETVAVALWNGSVQVRQRSDGSVVRTLDHATGRTVVTKVCFARKSPLLASAADDGTVKIWELPLGTLRTDIHAHLGRLTAVELTADGGQVLTAGTDGLARMWDAGTQQEIFQLRADSGIKAETDSALVASVWSHDHSVLATGHADNSIRLRDPHAG